MSLDVPEGVCLQCFNEQQRLSFPFLVYCAHRELLALVRSARDNTTFRCNEKQLRAVLAKLSSGDLMDALPPISDRL